MTYRGRVEHGVVVLANPEKLPEGAAVEVTVVSEPSPPVGAALEELAGAATRLAPDQAERHDQYRRERAS